ncbi:MAG: Zn-ribbon domain-containing OB-fold protein [Betaproteobacteria bacterium]
MMPQRPTDAFSMPRCGGCGAFHFYPRPACPKCGGANLDWAAASGGGSVYSFSVVHRAPSAEFKEQVPYVVAIVKTDEGPHLLSRVVGVAPEAVRIGMRLRARMQDGRPVFEPEKVAA